MKKLLLLLIASILFLTFSSSFAATLTTIYWWWPNNGSDCWDWYVPKDQYTYSTGTFFECIWHTYYTSWNYNIQTTQNSITMCDWEDRVVWITESNEIICSKYDDFEPTIYDDFIYSDQWIDWSSKTINLFPENEWPSWILETKWCEWVWCDPLTWTIWTIINISWDFNDTIRYQTWNEAGNWSTIWSFVLKMDDTGSEVSASDTSPDWKNYNIPITFSVTDPGGTWWWTNKYSWTDVNCSDWIEFENNDTIIQSENWNHTLYLCSVDWVWNESTWSGTYKVDKVAPVFWDISGNWIDKLTLDIWPTESEDFSISVDDNWLSPIINIEWFFEYNDNDSTESNIDFNWEPVSSNDSNLVLIRNVLDNYWWEREFTFKITEICDEAWNCLENQILNYRVLWINIPSVSYTWAIESNWNNAFVRWNFNWFLLKVKKEWVDYVYAIPSILNTWVENDVDDFVYDWYWSIPHSYKESSNKKIYNTWSINYSPTSFKIFERPTAERYSETELLKILVEIRKIYNNTPFVLDDDFDLILQSNNTELILATLSAQLNWDMDYKITNIPAIYK